MKYRYGIMLVHLALEFFGSFWMMLNLVLRSYVGKFENISVDLFFF